MPYDKPFLTYEEQLKKLINNYGLSSIETDKIDISLLKTISYYDLVNGYKECFMENDKFISGTKLIDIFTFNSVDKKFQNILFLASIYVENIFKTKMSYLISKNRGVDISEYLNPTKYHSSNPGRLKKMNDTLNDIKKVYHFSKDNPTKYYRENHNHIPPWILFKNVSFNTIIDLFSFLNKNEKLELISEYDFFITNKISDDEKIEMFKNMLNIVRKFRNKIAHNYKIIGVHLDKTMLHLRNIRTILPYKLISLGDIKNKRGENDLYSMVLSLLFLLEPYFLKLFFIYELNNFKDPGYINYFNKCNFPANFIENLQITSEKLREDLYMKFK